MKYLYDTYSTGNILTSQDAFDAHQKRIKWLQDIQQIAKKTSISQIFQKLKTSFYADQIPYEEFLNSAAYMLYQLNEKYKLHRTKYESFGLGVKKKAIQQKMMSQLNYLNKRF